MLLTAYQDVFSKEDNDVGRTDMGERAIPLLDGIWPIRQPPQEAGVGEKLVQKGVVEHADGA